MMVYYLELNIIYLIWCSKGNIFDSPIHMIIIWIWLQKWSQQFPLLPYIQLFIRKSAAFPKRRWLWPKHYTRNDSVQALATDKGAILTQSYNFPQQYWMMLMLWGLCLLTPNLGTKINDEVGKCLYWHFQSWYRKPSCYETFT